MFHILNKKKTIINPVFGKVKSRGCWTTVKKFPIELFGRTYLVKAYVYTDEISKDEYEPINERQEDAFKKTFEILKNKKEEIERVATLRFKMADQFAKFYCYYKPSYDLSDIPSRFEALSIEISRDGHSAIFVSDNAQDLKSYYFYDDYDKGFALSLIPEIRTYQKLDYFGHNDCLDSIVDNDDATIWKWMKTE